MSRKMTRNLVPLMLTLTAVMISALAQQPVSSSPTLTTEDVQKRNPSAVGSTVTRPVVIARQDQTEAAEVAWNEKYRRTLDRLKSLLRQADQAELNSVQARNEIYARAHQPEELNQLNARVSQQLNWSQNLRAEADLARAELDALLDEARVNGYQLRSFALFKANGDPDEQSFRERFLALQLDLRDAIARAEVMQLRVNRAGTKLRSIGCARFDTAGRCIGANDIFYENRVRGELNATRADLAVAQSRIAALRQQLADLQRQGELAGLPPGLFR